MCVCLIEKELASETERLERKEVKRQRQQGEQQGSCVRLSVEEAALHPATGASCPNKLLHLQTERPWEQTRVHLCCWHSAASCAFYQGDGEVTAACNHECLRARQICHRVQCESQPASSRALNHDSVYGCDADRLKG